MKISQNIPLHQKVLIEEDGVLEVGIRGNGVLSVDINSKKIWAFVWR